MYVKKTYFAICLGLAMVVGFSLSFIFNGLAVDSDLTYGDISKASRYSNQKEDPAFTVIEEKLRSDEEFFNDTKCAIFFLHNRMEVLSELSDETLAACECIPEFEPLMEELKVISARSFNTASAMENAGKSLEKIAAGKKAPEYEVFSNMAYVGAGKLRATISFGQKFFETVRAFLIGKDGGEYRKIAELASVWAVYCTQNAYLNSSESSKQELTLEGITWNPLLPQVPNEVAWKPSFITGGGRQPLAPTEEGMMVALGNSALGEYLNLLAAASEKVMVNESVDQFKNSFDEFIKNTAVEQVKNSFSEQFKNSISEQVRNSAVKQIRNISSAEVIYAAFPSESIIGSALTPRTVEVD